MPAPEQRPILVLGGDGYIGWPLSLRLAHQWPKRRVIIVDNLLRRRLVAQMRASSLLPVASPDERLAAARLCGIDNLEYVMLDVASPALAAFVDHQRPGLIYHLAQQCSAPFSMRDAESAILTLTNNETSNLRLLWAVREFVPDAHLVKMGSFGEYAKCGLDIPEGYFEPLFRGRTPERPMPYPREADDIYHVTKINDTNFISVACRKWGLRVTDVMQSTAFGAQTAETSRDPLLHTRFDYDECFGTVLNRFVVQALIGEPLTVYGTGHQRTGLIALEDSIARLAAIAAEAPDAGVHRVINNVTETTYSINEIADEIRTALAGRGCEVRIERAAHDPRGERPQQKMTYAVDRHLGETAPHAAFRDVVVETFEVLERWRDHVRPETLTPVTRWAPSPHAAASDESAENAVARPDSWWESLRERDFAYTDVNFNPGSLARPARPVQEACAAELRGDLAASPLMQYSHARATEARVRTLAHELWPLPGLSVTINHGATQVINLIALALSRLASPSQPIVVLSTHHEHPGGIGAFQRHPAFRVRYLSDEALHDPQQASAEIEACRPALLVMSHVLYDTGRELPVAQLAQCVQRVSPATLVLVDATQSAGLYPLPAGAYDAVVASTHKWLFGPLGGGLLWTGERFRRTCGALEWSGTGLVEDDQLRAFALAGGHFFPLYRGIEECLRLYRSIGPESILARSRELRGVFSGAILEAFRRRQIPVERLSPPDAAVLAVGFAEHDAYRLYRRLSSEGIHVKCIKGAQVGGRQWNILRFGFPYFESRERLERAVSAIRRVSHNECTPLEDDLDTDSWGHDIARI
jgi:UDP-sulfoquinovose synthase